MGGLVALRLALKDESLFDGLCLLAPSNKKPPFVSDLLYWSVGFGSAFPGDSSLD